MALPFDKAPHPSAPTAPIGDEIERLVSGGPQAWAPLLFTDEHPPTQPDPVAKATRSRSAQRKAQSKRTTSGETAHSYKSLLAELATLTRNTIRLPGTPATFNKLANPTPTQARALELAENAPVLT